MEKLKYRADIDGLRAVAVIGVLLFHAGLSFSGGFIGVDIFFVISGFLITSLILKAQSEDRFSMRVFLGRRIRRLMPAALLMTTVTLVAGYWLLIPGDYDKLAESAIAQMALVSNHYFANSMDYFAGPAELVPLLHTWSLAVEEQFYLVFPLILILCRNVSRKRLCIIICSLAAVSMAVNLWAVHTYPTEAFFILPTRAWEMLLGAIILFIPELKKTLRKTAEIGSLTAITAIVAFFFLYNQQMDFPGLAALWPCLATAALLYFNKNGNSRTSVSRFLSMPALTYMGKISYSLYLWHWPIIVYLRYTNHLELDLQTSLLGITLSLIAGIASYHLIENPFRLRRLLPSQKRLVLASTSFSLMIMGTGAGISENDGLPKRWNSQITELLATAEAPMHYIKDSIWDPEYDRLPPIGISQPIADRPKILVWGDSHSLVVAELCHELAKRHQLTGFVAARGGTVPMFRSYRVFDRENTMIWNNGVMNFIQRHDITHVIMAARWSDNIEGNATGLRKYLITDDNTDEYGPHASRQVFKTNIHQTLEQLGDWGIKVWIMEQVPLQHHDPIYESVTSIQREEAIPRGVSLEEHANRQQSVRAILRNIDLPNVTVFDPAPGFFTADGHARYMENNTLYYVDDNHLSKSGAKLFLKPQLEKIFESIQP